MPQLSKDDLQTACNLMLECYDRNKLDQLLRTRLLLRLEWVASEAGLAQQVAELFDYAGRNRLEGRLLREAAEFPPPQPKFAPLVAKYPLDPEAPQSASSALVAEAVGAFGEVRELLSEESARARLDPFFSAYRETAIHVDLLSRYKILHDTLHTIQIQYREIANAAQQVALGNPPMGLLAAYADGLEEAADIGDRTVVPLQNPGAEQTWLLSLRRAVKELRTAAEPRVGDSPAQAADESLRLLLRILARDPSRLHGLIVKELEVLPLPTLVFSLREMGIVSAAADAVKGRITEGLAALETLHRRLAWLVAEHTAWQNLDNSLRLAESSWYELLDTERRRTAKRVAVPPGAAEPPGEEEDSQSKYAGRLLEDWPDVANKFAEVRSRAAASRKLDRLVKYADNLQTAAEAKNFGGVFDAFEPFARMTLLRFIEVDKELLGLANDLSRIGDPLEAIIKVMRP